MRNEKVALGAASGIGRKFAHACARAGGGRAMAVAMDVTYEKAVNAGTAAVVDTVGKLDIPISNAGSQTVKPIVDICPGSCARRRPEIGGEYYWHAVWCCVSTADEASFLRRTSGAPEEVSERSRTRRSARRSDWRLADQKTDLELANIIRQLRVDSRRPPAHALRLT